MFDKILIANRGEIAVRIIRTCKEMGIRTVAVYSEADFRNLHLREAEEVIPLGGARPQESYLAKEKIIDAALKSGAQAIHPGYGFLSENSRFAEMTEQAGLTFIGPPSEVIAILGDKIAAKAIAKTAGIPTVPSYTEVMASHEEAAAAAESVGFPVLLKPAAGGGGKGMRIVYHQDELAAAWSVCQDETRKAFGDDRIFIERYIPKPRHIEIQIFADRYGNVIHLGERECSIQRRYQKIVEESPSTALNELLRRKMGKSACELARKAGYVNAGTVEFIMDPDGNTFFLEMNTRLQVEHPVTEMVTGLDLVELQLRIAFGEPLPMKQEEVSFSGCAIEARICAEDPSKGFVPSVGLITRYGAPRGKNIRLDSGVCAGSNISVYYDSMLAKVISRGENREQARKQLVEALNRYDIEGVLTNIDFVNQILIHPVFVKGDLSTDFIADHIENAANPQPEEYLHFTAVATALVHHIRETLVRDSLKPMRAMIGSSSPPETVYEYVAKSDGDIFTVQIEKGESEFDWLIWVNDKQYRLETPRFEFYRRRLKLKINDSTHYFRIKYQGNFIWIAFSGMTRLFEIYSPREWKLARYMPSPVKKVLDNVLECPMPGLIVEVKVRKGDRIYRGQELLVIESMKMESGVASPCDGYVDSVSVQSGDAVETGKVLMTFAL